MAQLTIGDADGLRDLADRCRRAAQTAASTQADETDPEIKAALGEISVGALNVARTADVLAGWAEENR